MPTLVTMPKWGLTMQSGTITGWIVSEGDAVSAGDLLLTVETEKAVNDVEAPADGVVVKIVAGEGDEVPVMGPVAVIAAPGETVGEEDLAALIAAAGKSGPKAAAAGAGAGGGESRERRAASRDASGRINASPAARRRAEELGVDLAIVEATGPGGRITSDDIERAASAVSAAPKSVNLATASGLTLHALVAGPETAARKIVFLHGLGGSQTTWAGVLGEFVGDFRVAAIDLPGHGQSDKPGPDAFPYTIDALSSAVGDAIAELGLAPAVVVGHSLGGAVAMHLAHERPDAVSGLVLIASAGLGKEISGDLLDRVEADPSPEEARHMLELFFQDQKLILDRGVNDMHTARSQPGADDAMKAIAASVFSRSGQLTGLDERLEDVNVPTLIVWGSFDRVVPVGHAARGAEKIKGAWLEVMSGIGHVPQVEAPARLIETIKRWLQMAGPQA
jgi:pyruvate dehydrogenase E2 component (dihydrolipoamide acetyltransferase)